MKQKKIFNYLSVTFFCLLLLAPINGCKKRSDQDSSTQSKASQQLPISFANTIVTLAPTNSYGLMHWDTSKPAYKKFLQSPWGATVGEITGIGNSTKNEITESLKKIGIDINDKKTYEQLLSQGVLFLSSSSAGHLQLGLFFKSSNSADLKTKLTALKEQLTKAGESIEELKLKTGIGFSYAPKNSSIGQNQKTGEKKSQVINKLHVGWKDNLACISNDIEAVDQVLSADGKSAPRLISNPQFTKATAGLPSDENRYLTGYIDLNSILTSDFIRKELEINLKNPAQFPFKEVAFAGAMDKTPYYSARLTYNAADENQAKWFKTINASPSENITSTIPSNPLLFLSYDGQTIKQIKDLVLSSFILEREKAIADVFKKQTAFLDEIIRLAAVIRLAPVGASMLPVPDAMIVVESKNPEITKQQLLELTSYLSKDAKMPPIQWQEKKIGELQVKYMLTPMQVGIFVTTLKNFVIIASTEQQINLLNTLDTNKTFAKNLSSPANTILGKQPTVGNAFVSMEEVGSLIENLGGLLSMYAPQNEDIKKLLARENINAIKKMGTLVSSVTMEEGAIDMKSFYQEGSGQG